jgi:hypothetical protein
MDGLSYPWPAYPAGEPDNVVAQGQTVTAQGSGRLAFLGAASNGNTSGTVTVTYTDGTTSTADIGFSDWTLGGGGGQPAYGNRIALTTPYRNSASGTPQQITTDVFTTAPITLTPGKQVASITLPKPSSGGNLHIFAISVGA